MSELQSTTNSASTQPSNEEIDLVELFQGIWQQKWLVFAITALATLLAAAVAFTMTPIYESTASILPPQKSDVSKFNLGLSEAGITQFEIDSIYALVKRNALSDELKREIFEDFYLPNLEAQEKNATRQQLFVRFNKLFSVRQSTDKNKPELYLISMQSKDAAQAERWVNDVLKIIDVKTKAQMQSDVRSELSTRLNSAKQTISVLQTAAQNVREDRLVRLREALQVAEAVGLESPRVTAGKTSTDGDLAEFIDGNLMYMRGAKAIRAELNVLEARKNDDPFIAELPALRNQIAFLERVKFESANADVFAVDNIAEAPEKPIKPKKALILVLGFVLGGMIGFFVALIRLMLVRRQNFV